jgi:hypothetical protein
MSILTKVTSSAIPSPQLPRSTQSVLSNEGYEKSNACASFKRRYHFVARSCLLLGPHFLKQEVGNYN